jgi:SAM-dependent methyltransferase
LDGNIPLDIESHRRWLEDTRASFPEWYQPVDLGFGVFADVTEPPTLRTRPDLRSSPSRGVAKWRYIIEPNLPDVSGARVLDLGCSSGVLSLCLAQHGAGEVVGVDRDESIFQRTNRKLPRQNTVGQARFVKKALSVRDGRSYDEVSFRAMDLRQVSLKSLDRFDMIMALCVVYHEGRSMRDLLSRLAEMAPVLLLQTNLGHQGKLARWASVDTHVSLLRELGFSVRVDWGDAWYTRPVIVANRARKNQGECSVADIA